MTSMKKIILANDMPIFDSIQSKHYCHACDKIKVFLCHIRIIFMSNACYRTAWFELSRKLCFTRHSLIPQRIASTDSLYLSCLKAIGNHCLQRQKYRCTNVRCLEKSFAKL